MSKQGAPAGKESRRSSMNPREHDSTTKAFERTVAEAGKPDTRQYSLRLYIAGASPKSARAVERVRRICEQHLARRYKLEVVDIFENPVLARGEQILAVPTLLKKLPAPLRRFIGDMSDTERILVGLDLRPTDI